MIYHIVGLVVGFLLDSILGDPYRLPHPVRFIGRLISFLEQRTLADDMSDRTKSRNGLCLVIVVCIFTATVSASIMLGMYYVNPILGCACESVLSYYALAAKSLKTESMKVYSALKNESLEAGRKAVSMIVGRDTEELSREGVIRAAVETVAENTSDGVIAPMIYLALGGPVIGFVYKAINTMDSMVGYKNDRYLYYGKWAAHLDDIVNFVPSRISAVIMIMAAFLTGMDVKRAAEIFVRDRFNHASPNSAQTESVIAGALGVRLAGPTSYFGRVHQKPYIGDNIREIELDDIVKANRLMYVSSIICLAICGGILCMAATYTGIL